MSAPNGWYYVINPDGHFIPVLMADGNASCLMVVNGVRCPNIAEVGPFWQRRNPHGKRPHAIHQVLGWVDHTPETACHTHRAVA